MDSSLPPPDPATRSADAPPPPEATRPTPPARLVVPLLVVGALVLAAVVGRALLGDDDERGTAADWNAFALADVDGGAITLVDRAGEEIDTITTSIDDPLPFQVDARTLVLAGHGRAALVDVPSREVREVTVPDDVRAFRPRGPSGTLVFAAEGDPGTAYVLDDDDELVDIADAAGWDDPRIDALAIVASPDGRHLAVPEFGQEEETALVSVPDGAITAVPGIVAAIDDDGVVTRSGPGEDGVRLERFDFDGASLGTVTGPRSLAGVVPGQAVDQLIGLTHEGSIVALSTDDGSSDEIGQLDVNGELERITRSFGDQPYLVAADEVGEETVLMTVAADGTGASTDPLPGTAGILYPGDGRGACVVAGVGDEAVVIDAATAEVHHRIDGARVSGASGSTDRCTVTFLADDEPPLITPDHVITPAEGVQIVGVSADGSWVIARRRAEGTPIEVVAAPIDAVAADGALDDAATIELDPRSVPFFVDAG